MALDYRTPGVLKVSMYKYLDEVLASWEKLSSSTGTKESATPSKLYVVRDKAELLDKKHKEGFHTVVAKMLFVAKRARDSGTSVAYLTTQVQEPDEDDWLKLDDLMNISVVPRTCH